MSNYDINEDEFVPVKGRISGPGTGCVIENPTTIVTVDGAGDADTRTALMPNFETAATFAEIVAGGSPRFIYVVEDENDMDNPGLYFFNGTSYFALTMTLHVPE